MKKSGLAVLLTISSLIAYAQKQSKSTKEPNTLLWEVTGNNLQKPSYLFGTMHILCSSDAIISENLKKTIGSVDEIYFELDMDNLQEMLGALQYLRMNDGVELQELLSPEEYQRVENYFKDNPFPMPLSMMNRFKPYFISSLIGEKMMSCEKKNGMEELIMKESKAHKKEIKGLETAAFQAGLFDSIPYAKQAKDLVAYIDSIDTYKETTLEMVDVYRKQDLQRMDSLIRKSDPGMEQYMDLLLYDRNRKWVKDFPGLTDNGKLSLLLAVGAGHLPGTDGVINLLRKQGFTVKPLQNDTQSQNMASL